VRTTLTLDDDVAAKLKIEARRNGKSFKEIVNGLLRVALNSKRVPPGNKAFKVDARPMGLLPGIDLDNIGQLIEQLDGPLHK
jgi:plasmid stability protein